MCQFAVGVALFVIGSFPKALKTTKTDRKIQTLHEHRPIPCEACCLQLEPPTRWLPEAHSLWRYRPILLLGCCEAKNLGDPYYTLLGNHPFCLVPWTSPAGDLICHHPSPLPALLAKPATGLAWVGNARATTFMAAIPGHQCWRCGTLWTCHRPTRRRVASSGRRLQNP